MTRRMGALVIQRSIWKTVLLGMLIMLVTLFSILGISLYKNSEELLRQADEQYTTLAVVEYTAGEYPDETKKTEDTMDGMRKIDRDTLISQEQVKKVHNKADLLGYVEGKDFQSSFSAPFFYSAVITFRVRYVMSNGMYRCTLLSNEYACNEVAVGTSFGLSQETLEDIDKYKLKKDHIYIANGNFKQPDVFAAVETSGIVGEDDPAKKLSSFPFVDITEQPDYLTNSPEMKYWNEIMEYYRVQNHSFQVLALDSILKHPDFFVGTKELKAGRLFTDEEAECGKKYCVISDGIADVLDLNVSDKITLGLHYSEDQTNYYASYSTPMGFTQKDEYTVIGIYDLPQTGMWQGIYLPIQSVKNPPKEQMRYEFATLDIQNGEGISYRKKIEDVLGEHIRMQIYDKGYIQTVEPIYAMQRNSVFIILLTVLCSGVSLFLFATLHIYKQKENVVILVALGTPKEKIHQFFSTGTYIIVGIGSVLGAILGYGISDVIAKGVYAYSVEKYSKDLRFSNLTLGIRESFVAEFEKPVMMIVLVVIAIFAITVLICRVYTEKVIQEGRCFGGNQPERKHKTKAVEKKMFKVKEYNGIDYRKMPEQRVYRKRSQLCFMFEQSVQSIIRNRKVSTLMILIPLVSTIFILIFTNMIEGYRQDKEEAYKTIPVNGYFTTIFGKQIDLRKVNQDVVNTVKFSRNYKEEYRSGTCIYEYIGKIEGSQSDEEIENASKRLFAEEAIRMKKPETVYAIEQKAESFPKDVKLIMTDELSRSKEFFGAFPPDVTYMEGFEDYIHKNDSGFLFKNDSDRIEVIMSETEMHERNIKLGDYVVISMIEIQKKRSTEIHGIILLDYIHRPKLCRVIGCFQSKESGNNMYTPFNKGVMETDYINYVLDKTDQLDCLRDRLQEHGMLPVGYAGKVRVSFVIEDRELVQTIDGIENSIQFLRLLRFFLFGMIVLIGFVSSYLSMKTRKEELAMMRSMGTGTIRTFFMFLLEQGIVTLIGCSIGYLVAVSGMTLVYKEGLKMVVLLYFCSLLGNALCIIKMNTNNVLRILSAAE